MSSRLTSALADFADGRWPDLREPEPRAFGPRATDLRDFEPQHWESRDVNSPDRGPLEPPLHPSELDLFENPQWSIRRWVPVGLIRFMAIFFIGVATTLVWQSYGNAARRRIADWSPRLAWLAPPAAIAAPAVAAQAVPPPVSHLPGPAVHASPDQLAIISRRLALVRQNVDKLSAEIARLHAKHGPVRTSARPPAAQTRRPAQTR